MSLDRALRVAASGASIFEMSQAVSAENFANAKTLGWNPKNLEVGSAGTSTIIQPGATDGDGHTQLGAQISNGVIVKSIYRTHEQNPMKDDASPYSLAIQGDPNSFFQYIDGDQVKLSRSGLCHLDNGQIKNSDGFILSPGISIPENVSTVTISADGKVSGKSMDSKEILDLGTIELARVADPKNLTEHNGYYIANANAGALSIGVPGEEGRGTLLQHKLETSGTKAIFEMQEMITASHAYNFCLQITKKVDEMGKAAANGA